LFKNNVNVTSFESVFHRCSGLTNIPEGLFKNNVRCNKFWNVFAECSGITSIPKNLFKNNVNVTVFSYVFEDCNKITSIPEDIVEFAKKVKERGGDVYAIFRNCTSASNYSSIPSYMK
jgi:dockerin type 1